MDLKHIAAQLTEVDLQELLARYAMNDAVRTLREAGRPITWNNVSQVMDDRRIFISLLQPSTLQTMFELISGQYMKGGWKEQIDDSGDVVHLTPIEKVQVMEDVTYMKKYVASTTEDNHVRTVVLVKLA